MQIGISTSCFFPDVPENAVEFLVENKVSHTELFLNAYCEMSEEYIKNLRARISDAKITVTSVHPFSSSFESRLFFSQYERLFYDGVEFYKRYFEIAASLGAPYLVFHGDFRDSAAPFERYVERFSKLDTVAKSFGVRLAQENVSNFKSYSVDFIKNLKTQINDIVFTLDIKQCRRAQQNIFEMASAMGKNIHHIHLSDANSTHDCLPPGSAEFDFKNFFSFIKNLGYTGNAVIELYRHNYSSTDTLISSLNYLRSCL